MGFEGPLRTSLNFNCTWWLEREGVLVNAFDTHPILEQVVFEDQELRFHLRFSSGYSFFLQPPNIDFDGKSIFLTGTTATLWLMSREP